MRVIAKQIAHTLATKGLTAACRMALVMILSRTLTPADYGAYALVGTIGTFGVLIVGLNLSLYIYRSVPGRTVPEQLSLFKATFLFEVLAATAIVAATVGGGALPGLLRLFHADGYELAFAIGLVLLVLLVALAEVLYFLQAQTRIEQANWVDFISQAVWVVPFVAWWALGRPIGVVTVLVAQIAGCVAALAVAARLIGIRAWWRAKPRWSEISTGIAFSVPMILPAVSFYALKLADRFILSSYWSLKEVGVYAFAYTLVNMLYTFTAWAIFNSFSPRIIAAHNTGDYAQRNLLQSYMVKVSTAAFLIGLAVLLVTYQPIIAAIARVEYRGAARPIPLLGLSYLFIILTYPAGNMLFMQNRVRASAVIDTVGMAVGIIANLLLIPRWSYMGAAVASTLGFATIMVAKYAYSATLSALRPDVLFSVNSEVRLLSAYYLRLRGAAD